jgi:hypothetical protein
MALLIDNDVTERVLETGDVINLLADAFEQVGDGDAVFQPRTDIVSPTATDGDAYVWGSMLGAIRDPPRLALRFKSDVLSWIDGLAVHRNPNLDTGVLFAVDDPIEDDFPGNDFDIESRHRVEHSDVLGVNVPSRIVHPLEMERWIFSWLLVF